MSKAATFLTFSLRDPAAGLALDRAALALNPTCSADLWNNLGDSLFALGRVVEAREAFLQALRISPEDVRARYNLVCVHIYDKDYPAALRTIAEGLALDRDTAYWKGFLKLQNDVLELLGRRRHQEGHLRVDRVSKALPPEDGSHDDREQS